MRKEVVSCIGYYEHNSRVHTQIYYTSGPSGNGL
jgi:hypothetical protein